MIYTASHIAEIVRGSIQAVPRGQGEAADAVALSGFQRMWYVVLPQAFRIAIPPIGNQYLNLIKNSSLGAAIGYYDLTLVDPDDGRQRLAGGSRVRPHDGDLHRDLARHVGDRQHRQPPARAGGTMTHGRSPPGALVWARRNLFRSPLDGAAHRRVRRPSASGCSTRRSRFIFVTGRWEIIQVNLRLLMIGRFPEAHVLRLAVTVVVPRRVGRAARRDHPSPPGPQRADLGTTASRVTARAARPRSSGSGCRRSSCSCCSCSSSTPGPWITVGVARGRCRRRPAGRSVRRDGEVRPGRQRRRRTSGSGPSRSSSTSTS